MNTLVVTAWGEPNSFARRVQEDPTLAVELYRSLKALMSHISFETVPHPAYFRAQEAVAMVEAAGDTPPAVMLRRVVWTLQGIAAEVADPDWRDALTFAAGDIRNVARGLSMTD